MESAESIVRVSCANENCGTFPMDKALHRKLKQTGEKFTCPSGHEQHFTESPLQQKQEQINLLKQRISKLQDDVKRLRQLKRDEAAARWEEQKRSRRLEKMLLDVAAGVIEVGDDEWKWSCECGSKGQKAFDTEEEARDHYERHLRRADCGHNVSEVTIES